MEVVYMLFDIEQVTNKDVFEINKILIKEVGKTSIKEIKNHIRKGIALKLVDENGRLAAFCLAKEFDTHFSLSYYFILEEQRKKYPSLFFFLHCFYKLKSKPIFIKKNKNFEQYSKYFEKTKDENILRFKNLREDEQWVELLKRLEK